MALSTPSPPTSTPRRYSISAMVSTFRSTVLSTVLSASMTGLSICSCNRGVAPRPSEVFIPAFLRTSPSVRQLNTVLRLSSLKMSKTFSALSFSRFSASTVISMLFSRISTTSMPKILLASATVISVTAPPFTISNMSSMDLSRTSASLSIKVNSVSAYFSTSFTVTADTA